MFLTIILFLSWHDSAPFDFEMIKLKHSHSTSTITLYTLITMNIIMNYSFKNVLLVYFDFVAPYNWWTSHQWLKILSGSFLTLKTLHSIKVCMERNWVLVLSLLLNTWFLDQKQKIDVNAVAFSSYWLFFFDKSTTMAYTEIIKSY